MRTRHLFYIPVIFVFTLLLASCEYEFIEIAGPKPPDPNDTTVSIISFAAEIAPIFSNDNCVACHNGSFQFDLKPNNAYNSIINNNLVTPLDPASSIIYTYPHPSTGSHNSKYSSLAEADSIAKWIYQGALDN